LAKTAVRQDLQDLDRIYMSILKNLVNPVNIHSVACVQSKIRQVAVAKVLPGAFDEEEINACFGNVDGDLVEAVAE